MGWFSKNDSDTKDMSTEELRHSVAVAKGFKKERDERTNLVKQRAALKYELSGEKERDEVRRARIEKAKGIGKKVGAGLSRLGGVARSGKQTTRNNPLVAPSNNQNPLLAAMERDRKKVKGSGSPLFDSLTKK